MAHFTVFTQLFDQFSLNLYIFLRIEKNNPFKIPSTSTIPDP